MLLIPKQLQTVSFTPGLVKQLGLQCQETDATLRLADATESTMVKLIFLYFIVWLSYFATELCADATLGNAFFNEHRAVLDFANPSVTLTVMANFTSL